MSRNTLLLVVGSLLALTACSNGVCAAVAVTTSGPNTSINFGQCWDEQDRSVACVRRGGGRGVSCTCAVNGNTGETFTRTAPLAFATPPTEAQLAPINTGCGWELRPR
jgi:hypothetical protein